MSMKQVEKWGLGLAAIFALASLGTLPATAQGKKARSTVERRQHPGGGFWSNERASRSIRHARDYSRSIARYTTQVETIDPAVAESESEMLGLQIQGIQREMATVGKQNASSPKIADQIKAIEKKLAQAVGIQTMLHSECCKDAPDGTACGDISKKITGVLNQIAKEHDELMKSMEYEDYVQRRKTGSSDKRR